MGSRLPAVDERLVAPEAHAEIIDGRVVLAPGSTEARGTLHAEASRLLAAVVAEGYAGALSMLTRTDELTDIAPDVSVFARGEDPETGGRWLEEIAPQRHLPDGYGENLAALYTLMASCAAHVVNPHAYLVDVLSRVGTHPANRIEELLPHRWQPLPLAA